MKRFLTMFCLAAVFILGASGCEARLAASTASGAEAIGDAYFYDEASGKVLTDLSDRFDFKIEQWELLAKPNTGEERLLFSVGIKNKTKTSLKNFYCDIFFNEDAVNLFTTGLTVYEMNEPIDLIPDVTANGSSYAFDLSVNTDEQAAEFGAEKSDLLEKVRYITLKLRWSGGEETVQLDCGKIEMTD